MAGSIGSSVSKFKVGDIVEIKASYGVHMVLAVTDIEKAGWDPVVHMVVLLDHTKRLLRRSAVGEGRAYYETELEDFDTVLISQ